MLFNKLEQICTYIANDLTAEEIVYPALHSELLEFIKQNNELFTMATTPNTPFVNIHLILKRWQNHSEQDKLKQTTDGTG